jgi:carbon-monoxide dehydrogenase catalytic subunit
MVKEAPFADKASQDMIQKAEEENIKTVWDRYENMQPQCKFGSMGVCCHICSMGPCRINPNGKGPQTGICGVGVDALAARNLARMIAAGAAAHSDHGRAIAHTLYGTSKGEGSSYQIKDPHKLQRLADHYKITTEGSGARQLAGNLSQAVLQEFGQPWGEVKMALSAPAARVARWRKLAILPRAIDREIVEMMHRTHIGVDSDFRNIIKQGLRVALADGWGGSMIASELSDILFGTPRPLQSSANLGVLREDWVNVLVHGHEPTLSDIIAVVSQDPELVSRAQKQGAKGINIGGICCTANEILMRHGIPLAGNFLQQELALMTGAVDLMLVDVQCVMPGLETVARCFHTKLISTSEKAKLPGFTPINFHENNAINTAKEILNEAIENFPNRNKERVHIPQETEGLVAGFTTESIFQILGGHYRATYRPLNDAIISGRLRGVAGVIGCSNPNVQYEEGHTKMVRELIKNDTLVVTTGCNAVSCAKHGLLRPETAFSEAGKGLQEICQAVGIPPVLHLGSCVDNSRILKIMTHIIAEGGLGEDLSDLPAAGAAPEWMSEKAVTIGFYFVASGIFTVLGRPLPITGSPQLLDYLTGEIEQETGGKWAFEENPIKAAHQMLAHIDKKRKNLQLKPLIHEQSFKFSG